MRDMLPSHGGQLQYIADKFAIPVSTLLDFSANINPEGPPLAVHTTLRQALDEPSVLTAYPELGETALRKAIARYAGVRPENIVVANGFVPLLDATLRAMAVRQCVLPVPAFIEYRRTLEHASVEIIAESLNPGSHFRYDIESLLNGSHDSVLLANPQNPTGILHNREILSDLTFRAAERNILVLLDEAFIDYCPEASLAVDAECHPNLIVFRSVTKFFGMPGLRVSYAVSSAKAVSRIQDLIAPWSITTLASRAAAAAMEDGQYISQTKMLNNQRRAWLDHALKELSLRPESSSANFILFQLPLRIDPIAFWRRMIEEHSIVLRLCSNYEAFRGGYLRTAVRSESENQELIKALRQTLLSFKASVEVISEETMKG
jgi:threonine-phosphate decarboxylase